MLQNFYIQSLIYIVKLLFPDYWKLPTSLVFAQAAHETAFFKSDIFKENKNLFGMKQAKRRKNTATGTNRYHATYDSLMSSIYDYFLRQKDFNIVYKNNSQYVDELIRTKYAEDPHYRLKLFAVLAKVKIQPVIKFLLTPALLYILYKLVKLLKQNFKLF